MPHDERLSKDDILKLAIEGYSYELKALIKLFQSDVGSEIISLFSDYESFVKEKRSDILGDNTLQTLANNNLIDATTPTSVASKLFACANLAASCEVFNGWSMPLSAIDLSRADEYLNMAISDAVNTQTNLGQNMAVRLNNSDTVRVIQILRLLGILETGSECYQLATGSSIGIRDRIATHITPKISINHFLNNAPVQFSTVKANSNNIVLIDNDPNMKTAFEQLSISDSNIHTINKDMYIGLDEAAKSITNNELKPRTLVTAYRLEPRAYADTSLYLSKIGGTIAAEADFITTIGSGDTDEEFKNRKQVIDDLYADLVNRGMEPIRIKMYKGETTKQQRFNPLFGLNQYASYDILYCKLKKACFTIV